MTQAERIIERFGGTSALATALGFPKTTVQTWKDSGFIPAKHHQSVLEAGRALEEPLSPADFFDESEDGVADRGAKAACAQ